MAELAAKYRDRAAERREGVPDKPDASREGESNETSEENDNQIPVVEEPPCAHPNCIRPGPNPERDLSWIKCLRKTCKKWHHYECVGLDYSKDYKDRKGYPSLQVATFQAFMATLVKYEAILLCSVSNDI